MALCAVCSATTSVSAKLHPHPQGTEDAMAGGYNGHSLQRSSYYSNAQETQSL